MNALSAIRDASIARVSVMIRGEPVTNICAGESNPIRLTSFVKYQQKSYTNKHGITHTDHFAQVKSKDGRLHIVGIDVIYPGHLDYAECERLFKPYWEAQYGKATQCAATLVDALTNERPQ